MVKRRRFVTGVVIGIVALILGVVLYLVVNGRMLGGDRPATPGELVSQYFTLVSQGRYNEIYPMLNELSKAEITKKDFGSKYKNIYGGIKSTNLSFTVGQTIELEDGIDKNKESEVVKLVGYSLSIDTIAGSISLDGQMVFIQNEDKEYKIQWSPQLIFPSLAEGDKVRVNTLKAERGGIYDRNGSMLAGTGVASSVGFVPGKMRTINNTNVTESGDISNQSKEDTSEWDSSYNQKDIAKVAKLLDMTTDSILKKLNASYVKDNTFVQLKNIPKDSEKLTKALLTVKGIMITTTPVRYYPLAEKASHLVGYIQGITAQELEDLSEKGYTATSVIGKSGLEKIYEEKLRAIDGYEIVILNKDGELKETVARIERTNGSDIRLTIDVKLQTKLYDLFSKDKSSSVAMNPKTGEVLALVSTPTYNANDFILGMSSKAWTALNEDEDKPMYNRFKAALCPGSTFKAVTAAIGLETGVVTAKDDFGHSGLRWKKDSSWGGYYISTTMEYGGAANLEHALMYSDNIYFGKLALKIGADSFVKELERIGFTKKIPFEFGLYSSIVSNKGDITSEIQLADSGFGQGEVLTNPIHLASIYSAFVNNGSMISPHLILKKDEKPKFWIEHAFTKKTANTVRGSLVQVIERGSATDAKVSGLTLAGKTGTAEIKQSKNDTTGTELGWFVQFTADNKEKSPLMVVTMVEDVKGRGGSHYVSPKVKTVFEKD